MGFGRKRRSGDWGKVWIDNTYYCSKCSKRHRLDSKVGKKHKEYELPGW